jgi:hypothetical protein
MEQINFKPLEDLHKRFNPFHDISKQSNVSPQTIDEITHNIEQYKKAYVKQHGSNLPPWMELSLITYFTCLKALPPEGNK